MGPWTRGAVLSWIGSALYVLLSVWVGVGVHYSSRLTTALIVTGGIFIALSLALTMSAAVIEHDW